MKKYRGAIVISVIITLLPLVASAIFWEEIPNQVATHFDLNWQANGWSSKGFALIGLPFLLAGLQLLVAFFVLNDPKQKVTKRWIIYSVLGIIPLIALFVQALTISYALGNQATWLMKISPAAFIGIIFIVSGVILTAVPQNYTVGIRLPWTLSSEQNWLQTNRLGAKTFIAGGILMLLASFVSWEFLMMPIIVIVILIPTIYSFWLHRKGI
ncbi:MULTISPECIES: SdpI family protein [Enterococcus]|uniref:Hemolysin expression modulating protein n=1 Tax=Enterococcus thailandicus TaxID=417368 RepID=A0A179EUL1_ENTTH|nr:MULTISPECIES: SdpI family protein [Enterococcus]ASZ08059.1 hemolysin expression modulating protein [Enterococcus thailandicus]MDA3964231.1 SdpI family protein [Enterococcus thailandicus]MDT2752254.1 SdpI family protein [Enterococcus thailandicus]MDT2776747.1 SdpI family protein [Enterococcus thailandicus]MDT2793160.1 SdpI family protein [Enterococcus thailandicus]